MIKPARYASDTAGEEERVAALRGYGILDTPNEPAFDAIVSEAAKLFEAPIALISLIDTDRQWFKAKVGLEGLETPRTISFCTHAIRGPEVFVVEDAELDTRFSENPMVTGDPNVRFYAGAPLKTPTGKRIGTLCVLDNKSRGAWSDQEKAMLEALAERTMTAFEAR